MDVVVPTDERTTRTRLLSAREAQIKAFPKAKAPAASRAGVRLTPDRVRAERDAVRRRDDVVELINETRTRLGEAFETDVDRVTAAAYRGEVDRVFAEGDRAVNVAACVALLRDLDVAGDYPGFVVDERLGRLLAATVAGGEPLTTLAEATFHVADVHTDGDGPAGRDDLTAALAAGFQARLPGWPWTSGESPFAVDPPENG